MNRHAQRTSITREIPKYEDSDGHAEACVAFDQWRHLQTIGKEIRKGSCAAEKI